MPHLKLHSAALPIELKRRVAKSLTDLMVRVTAPSNRRPTIDETRVRTTVQFAPWAREDFAVGGTLMADCAGADYSLEVHDWGLSVGRRRKLALELTPLLCELLGERDMSRISVRFYSYSPSSYAVSGKLLKDGVPRLGRLVKRLSR